DAVDSGRELARRIAAQKLGAGGQVTRAPAARAACIGARLAAAVRIVSFELELLVHRLLREAGGDGLEPVGRVLHDAVDRDLRSELRAQTVVRHVPRGLPEVAEPHEVDDAPADKLPDVDPDTLHVAQAAGDPETERTASFRAARAGFGERPDFAKP